MGEENEGVHLPWHVDHPHLTNGAFWRTSVPSKEFRRRLETLESNYQDTAVWVQMLGIDIVRNIRAWTYMTATLAYRFAEILSTCPRLWEEFQRLEFWEGHARLDHARCLSYSLMYFYGSHQGQVAERARDHARALSRLKLEGVPAAWLPTLLNEEGGFSGLKVSANTHAPHRARETTDQRAGTTLVKLQLTIEQEQIFDSLTSRDEITIELVLEDRKLNKIKEFVIKNIKAASNHVYPKV